MKVFSFFLFTTTILMASATSVLRGVTAVPSVNYSFVAFASNCNDCKDSIKAHFSMKDGDACSRLNNNTTGSSYCMGLPTGELLTSLDAVGVIACTAGCETAEAAGEVACALEIFGEPECGIAVAVAGSACNQACPSN